MPFDFVMFRHEGHWVTRDVFVEGVSLIANIRSQFKRISRDSSYAGLVARMKGQTLEAPPARPLTTIDAIPRCDPELRDGAADADQGRPELALAPRCPSAAVRDR